MEEADEEDQHEERPIAGAGGVPQTAGGLARALALAAVRMAPRICTPGTAARLGEAGAGAVGR